MDTKTLKFALASVALTDAYTDFILSRQAMQCSPYTLTFYRFTSGAFLTWAEGQGITRPDEVTARHVRAYLAGMVDKGRADTTMHDHARAIRTLLRFWHAEKYMPDLVTFDMPRLSKKRLPVLSVEELKRVIAACTNPRDRALVMLLADSGLRRSEVCALNWDDVDFSNGLLRVKRGKGGKARSAVVGVSARRALLAYRRVLSGGQTLESSPMFLTQEGARIKPMGLGVIFLRLSRRAGVHVTAHALRRTFVILSLRNGMDVLHLQAMLGHADLTMVQHYAQMVDEDLLQAHQEHSPIDRL